MPLLKGRTDPFNMLENIRYDQMFAVLGCHAEHVETPADLRPALERAFASGKASLVNVVGDKRIGHPRLGGNLLGSTQVVKDQTRKGRARRVRPLWSRT